MLIYLKNKQVVKGFKNCRVILKKQVETVGTPTFYEFRTCDKY